MAHTPLPPHAVVFPVPYQGHINPLFHLAIKLARTSGFSITFVNSEYNHSRLVQSHLKTGVPLPQELMPHLHFRLVAISDGLPPNHGREVGPELLSALGDCMGPAFEDLIEKQMKDGALPVTCIIADMFLTFVVDVANKFGIPYVGFYPQSATSFACHKAIAQAFFDSSTESSTVKGTTDPSELSQLINTIPGTPHMQWTDNITFLQCGDPTDFVFQFMTRPFRRIREYSLILINSFYELEGDCDILQDPVILPIGPLLPSEYFGHPTDVCNLTYITSLWPEENECLRWLDGQDPSSVLYVSFGSLAIMPSNQMMEFALGLEASQLPFLWALRPDLISGSSSIFPHGFLDRVKSRAFFVSWAPQLQVLSHPSVGGFLTHAGWNSTLESISQAIPMVCWPWFADQPMNRRFIVDKWKVGLDLEANEEGLVSRGVVEEMVRAMVEGEKGKGMRERGAVLRDAARRAVMEGGSSHTNCRRLAETLQKETLQKATH